MTALALSTPILEDGIAEPHYFNGRILVSEDLRRDQTAGQLRALRLGQATGSGIVHGLTVAKVAGTTHPMLRVEAGMAVNALGQTLLLPTAVDVDLVANASAPAVSAASSGGARTFVACVPPETSVYIAGAGVYLLVLAPAYGTRGAAPSSGLPGTSASCNADVDVEGVMFRCLPIDVPPAVLADKNTLRNWLAYRAFGVFGAADETMSFVKDPFGAPPEPGTLFDNLRAQNLLSDCDVPLAMFYWTNSDRVVFVDMWAVRRGMTSLSALGPYGDLLTARRTSEGEARFLQFQDHLADLRLANPAFIQAKGYFKYLPPAGILPLVPSGRFAAFDRMRFFSDLTTRGPIYVEGARVEALLRASLTYPPLDLNSGVFSWLYAVRESAQQSQKASARAPYLIFASGYMPFVGDARFDAAHIDFMNASPR